MLAKPTCPSLRRGSGGTDTRPLFSHRVSSPSAPYRLSWFEHQGEYRSAWFPWSLWAMLRGARYIARTGTSPYPPSIHSGRDMRLILSLQPAHARAALTRSTSGPVDPHAPVRSD